ncbi:MAG: hypothetical protein FJ295_06350 [Planctomycetes bacterium]|nr:hypothetical protein [Planctomycetota bacterium]
MVEAFHSQLPVLAVEHDDLRRSRRLLLLMVAIFVPSRLPADDPPKDDMAEVKTAKDGVGKEAGAEQDAAQWLRGRVVFLAEVLESRGARSVPDARQRVLALETERGELIPLLEDRRGHAFRADDRLRKMELELLVRRLPGTPVVQIINVVELTKGGRFEIDYWCDVCAIVMFELKPCECCQGEIELRRRPLAKDRSPLPGIK